MLEQLEAEALRENAELDRAEGSCAATRQALEEHQRRHAALPTLRYVCSADRAAERERYASRARSRP